MLIVLFLGFYACVWMALELTIQTNLFQSFIISKAIRNAGKEWPNGRKLEA